jgi:hypothetical protein
MRYLTQPFKGSVRLPGDADICQSRKSRLKTSNRMRQNILGEKEAPFPKVRDIW